MFKFIEELKHNPNQFQQIQMADIPRLIYRGWDIETTQHIDFLHNQAMVSFNKNVNYVKTASNLVELMIFMHNNPAFI